MIGYAAAFAVFLVCSWTVLLAQEDDRVPDCAFVALILVGAVLASVALAEFAGSL